MAITYSDWLSVRYGGSASSRTHTLGATPTAGETILVMVWRSNGASTGAQNHATISGFTEVGHYDPTSTSRAIGTLLKKTAAGTEGALVVDWSAADSDPDQVICSVVVDGDDYTSVAVSFVEGNSTTWTYSADAGDSDLHTGCTANNKDLSSSMYPSGDTNITHSAINYRNGGIALSGGATGTTHASAANGSWATISLTDGAAGALPMTSVSNFTEGEEVHPATDLGTVGIDVAITGTGTATAVEYTLIRDSDSWYWNGTAWQAGAVANSATISQALPYTHSFTNGPTTEESVGYEIKTNATTGGGTSADVSRNITAGTWEYAPDITFTTFVGADPPTVSIDTPPTVTVGSGSSDLNEVPSRTSWRESNPDATGIDITGVSASATSTVDYVETRIDVGSGFSAWTNVTNTGTAYDTWSHSHTAPTIEGGSALIEVRSVDITATLSVVDQMWVEFNAIPVLTSLSPATGTELPAASGLAVTASGHDLTDRVPEARGIPDWVLRLVDETPGVGSYRHWNGTGWTEGPTDTSYIYNFVFDHPSEAGVDDIVAENIPNLVLDAGMSLSLQLFPRDVDGEWAVPTTVALTTATTAPPAEPTPTVIQTDPYIPSLVGAPAAAGFRVMFGDLKSGKLLGQLPVTALTWSDVLNGSGVVQVKLSLNVELNAPIKEAATTLWVEEDGTLVKGAIVWAVSVDGDSLTLSGEGFHSYLRRRYVTSDLILLNMDQFQIADQLVGPAGSSVGIIAFSGNSGVTRTRRYRWWNNKNVGEAVDELAAVENGFDFRYAYSWDPGNDEPNIDFVPSYPAVGRDIGLILDDGLPGVELVGVDSDATQLATTQITVGEGNEAATVRDVRSDPVGLGTYVPLETVKSYSTVKNVSTLVEHAGFDLARARQPIARAKVRLTGPNTAGYRAGDQATVKGEYGLSVVDGVARIMAVNVSYATGQRVADLDLVFTSGGWSSKITPKKLEDL